MKNNRGHNRKTGQFTLSIICIAGLILNLSCNTPKKLENVDKPNVIIINADDLGYGDIGSYGAKLVNTPAMDRLAKEGRMFFDAHSASSICTPSRYALMTGQYPCRINLYEPIFFKSPLVIDTSQITIAKVMKRAGYATSIIGKWHFGFGKDSIMDWNKELNPGPLELGFDYFFGIPVVNSHPPFVYVENHHICGYDAKDPMVYGKHAETRWFPEKFDMDAIGGARAAHALYDDRSVGTTLKNKAVTWIREHKKEPFFLYLATTNIHHPFTPAPRFIGTSKAGRYGDFINELDWIVSEVMKTLDEENLTNNTLLILTSDNGGMLNQGGQDAWRTGHRINGKLLGFKFDIWEGGHRVPFIACWPGKIPAGTKSDELLCNVDLLATLAAIVKYPLKNNEARDSYNMLPALVDSPQNPIRKYLIISSENPRHLAVRKGKWMYIPAQGGGGSTQKEIGSIGLGGPAAFLFTKELNSDIENGKIKDDAPPAQLYDLKSDLSEQYNLYNEHPEIVAELEELLKNIE